LPRRRSRRRRRRSRMPRCATLRGSVAQRGRAYNCGRHPTHSHEGSLPMPARSSRFLLALTLVIAPAFAVRGDTADDPSVARMGAALTFLTSAACEGRGPGTAGIDKAADYIAAAFKAAGLRGAMPDGDFFQPFTVRGNPALVPGTAVTITGP